MMCSRSGIRGFSREERKKDNPTHGGFRRNDSQASRSRITGSRNSSSRSRRQNARPRALCTLQSHGLPSAALGCRRRRSGGLSPRLSPARSNTISHVPMLIHRQANLFHPLSIEPKLQYSFHLQIANPILRKKGWPKKKPIERFKSGDPP